MRDEGSPLSAHTDQEGHEGKSENSSDLPFAKGYRLTYPLMDAVNFNALAGRSLFLSALGGHPGAHQIKLMES